MTALETGTGTLSNWATGGIVATDLGKPIEAFSSWMFNTVGNLGSDLGTKAAADPEAGNK